ncbi:hypothetical protein SAMN05720764_103168 [Fibrobacter sp. UWH5]|uniref:hypothetical protein n=1 Tax=Fibrobacter sp. UWH5 TaxID=1896211 RepID=UPI00091C113F|nr:hypothetical protein [Fibrobacter sp. UWH5]SHK73571.1 hypothetical protein SAMN05720764_103168 [Fibrobacter sp. UWH5]
MFPAVLAPILIEVGKQALMLAVAEFAPYAVKAVGGAIKGVLDEFGINFKDGQIEMLGERLLQAREKGLKMDGEESFEDYFNRLGEMNLDDSIKHSESEQLVAATQALVGALVEKMPQVEDFLEVFLKNPLDGLLTVDTVPVMSNLLKMYLHDDRIETIGKYMKGKESSLSKIEEAQTAIAEIEKKANPGLSDAEAQKIAFQREGK